MLRPVITPVSTRHRLFLAGLAGVLCTLAFPRTYWWWCAWIGLIPLFFSIEQTTRPRAFLAGYAYGIVFWTATVSWLMHVTAAGMILLVLYLSLYPAIFCFFCARWNLSSSPAGFFAAPALWVILEYVRSHALTGFGWALLGYSQAPALAVIQIADMTGPYGVSFLVVLINLLLYRIFRAARGLQSAGHTAQIAVTGIAVILCAASVTYGYAALRRDYSRAAPSSRVIVIQPNIPQELKWYAPARSFIADTYARMNKQASFGNTGLIIWPEAALPGILGEAQDREMEREFFAMFADAGVPVLFGAVRIQDGEYFNSALLTDKTGNIETRYDKIHLVPFGEYVPLKKALPFLEAVVPIGDMSRGTDYVLFGNNGLRFAALICFEDVFPELARAFVLKGADVLVNITNDAWYMHTAAAEQHFQASIFRAVENRRYLARSANTGVSGFVDPHGRVIGAVRSDQGDLIFGQGESACEVRAPAQGLTLYGRYGDMFVLFCCGILGGAIVSWRISRGGKKRG